MANPLLLAGFAAVAITVWVCRADFAVVLGPWWGRIELTKVNPAAAAHVANGKVFLGQGDYNNAIAEDTEALAIDPNYAAAYEDRGNAYLYEAEYTLAIADYDQAIQLYPSDAIAYFGRAVAYYNGGDYKRALEGFDEAIRFNPRYALAHTYRRLAYMNKDSSSPPSPLTLMQFAPARNAPALAGQAPAMARATTSQPWSARSESWSASGESWPTMWRSGSFGNTPWHGAPAASGARTTSAAPSRAAVGRSGWTRR